jgi:hypothetical protein
MIQRSARRSEPYASVRRWIEAMRYLLVLLVAVTMACGAAASMTILFAPAYVGGYGEGY